MTGRGRCEIAGCGWSGPSEDQRTGQARAVWHVYEVHPEAWAALAAISDLGSAPVDPRPDGPVR